jgi:hypothetical protein
MVRSVPGDAHWPNAAEKPVELVSTELAGVWDSFPDLPFRSALKVAVCRLHAKYRPLFKSSRLSMRLGVPLKITSARAAFIQSESNCYAAEFERLGSENGCYGRQRQRVNSIRARTRLATCARAQLTRQRRHPVQINSGDFFMFWRSSSKKSNRL